MISIAIGEPKAQAPLGVQLGMTVKQVLALLPMSEESLIHYVDFKDGENEPLGGQIKLNEPALVLIRLDGQLESLGVMNGTDAVNMGIGFEEGLVDEVTINYAAAGEKAAPRGFM